MSLPTVRTALAAAALSVLLAGCGGGGTTAADPAASSSPSDGESHVMSDGSVMDGAEHDMDDMDGMDGMDHGPAEEGGEGYGGMSQDYSAVDEDGDGEIDREGADGRASETATMVCADQIRSAVQRTLQLPDEPVGQPSWDGTTYTCTYAVAGGRLVASVRDDTADSATTGRGWFRVLRTQLPGAKRLPGIIGLGFPSYAAPTGHVVFLKDHKTLHVDGSGLPDSALPRDFSRQDVAYAVASAVMVCWTA